MRRTPLLRLAREDGRRTKWRRQYSHKPDGWIEPVSTRDQKKKTDREKEKCPVIIKHFIFLYFCDFQRLKKKPNKQTNKRVYEAVYMYKPVFMFFGKGDEQLGP